MTDKDDFKVKIKVKEVQLTLPKLIEALVILVIAGGAMALGFIGVLRIFG